MKTATRCVRPESNGDPFGAISPPIYQTATFRQETVDEFGEYDYTRSGNPTRTLVERQIADLEGGAYACAFASGMAAITALTRLVSPGEEILCGSDLYGGTIRLLDQVVQRMGVSVKYVDTSDLDSVKNAITPRTKLLLLESPTNPLLRISDIESIAALTREAGILFAVDNSMLSPCLQRPLSLGADVVVHSATKFLCGHSDVTGGAIVTDDPELHAEIAFHQNAEGAGLAPFESWLLIRGIKTLDLRVERQNNSAAKIAEFLTQQPIVNKVYYPGLSTHPGFETHRRQASGGGSVISFSTGDPALSKRIIESLTLFDIAVSFGSVGSVISMPCTMSHASVPAALREKLAPPADLIRVSVGIEAVEDLIADLENAFEKSETLYAIAAATSSRI